MLKTKEIPQSYIEVAEAQSATHLIVVWERDPDHKKKGFCNPSRGIIVLPNMDMEETFADVFKKQEAIPDSLAIGLWECVWEEEKIIKLRPDRGNRFRLTLAA